MSDIPPLEFVTLRSGLRMGFFDVGPRDGQPVLLLHGFPEFHYSWRMQWPALTQAGYRVIAPDQRGYNLSGKHGPYDLATLARDMADLQDALGITQCDVAGHDFGGAVAYALAAHFPQRVRKLGILNAPHPDAYLDALRSTVEQRKKSWYVFFFQLPFLPERRLARNNFAFVEQLFAGAGATTPSDIARYKTACAQPGALHAMIGWYRALGRGALARGLRGSLPIVRAETCVIWGERDLALSKDVNITLARHVPNACFAYLTEASHWVQLDAPEAVNQRLIEHFARA
jgi:epoxide hydrolase 4